MCTICVLVLAAFGTSTAAAPLDFQSMYRYRIITYSCSIDTEVYSSVRVKLRVYTRTGSEKLFARVCSLLTMTFRA